jgi:hypothetical protein
MSSILRRHFDAALIASRGARARHRRGSGRRCARTLNGLRSLAYESRVAALCFPELLQLFSRYFPRLLLQPLIKASRTGACHSRGSPADIIPFARFLEWRQRRLERAPWTGPAPRAATGEDPDREAAARLKGGGSRCQTSAPDATAADVGRRHGSTARTARDGVEQRMV